MPARRRALERLAAAAIGALLPAARAAAPAVPVDLCTTPTGFDVPLYVPGNGGLMGRLPLGHEPVTLRAVSRGGAGPALAYAARAGGRDFAAPTLVARTGARVRVRLDNGMAEPTVVHWHGFTIDTQNDGNGEDPVAPGGEFTYAFTVRNLGSCP